MKSIVWPWSLACISDKYCFDLFQSYGNLFQASETLTIDLWTYCYKYCRECYELNLNINTYFFYLIFLKIIFQYLWLIFLLEIFKPVMVFKIFHLLSNILKFHCVDFVVIIYGCFLLNLNFDTEVCLINLVGKICESLFQNVVSQNSIYFKCFRAIKS